MHQTLCITSLNLRVCPFTLTPSLIPLITLAFLEIQKEQKDTQEETTRADAAISRTPEVE